MATPSEWLRALVPSRQQLESNPWLGKLAPWLVDPRVWQWSRRRVATGAAVGLFVGLLLPVAQIPLAAAAAVVLRANIAVAVAATLVSNPLTVPPLYFAAYHLGAWATGASTSAALPLIDPAAFWQNIGAIGRPLFAGLGITAIGAGVASYLLISQLWIWRVAAKRQRTRRRSRGDSGARGDGACGV